MCFSNGSETNQGKLQFSRTDVLKNSVMGYENLKEEKKANTSPDTNTEKLSIRFSCPQFFNFSQVNPYSDTVLQVLSH